MKLRKILVPLTGHAAESAVLATSFDIAKATGAHLVGLYAKPNVNDALPLLTEGMSGEVVEQLLKTAKADSEKALERIFSLFRQEAEKAGVKIVSGEGPVPFPSARFLDIVGQVDDLVAVHSRLSDLVVFGQGPEAKAASTLDVALMSAGRPVLITTNEERKSFSGTIVIGWDNSPEAAHAVTAAIPFLENAAKVEILSIGNKAKTASAHLDLVVEYLAIHGIKAGIRVVEPAGKPAGGTLLAEAVSMNADLLVVGGYGHSKLREFFVGSVTEQIRLNATLPLLMAH